MSYMKTMTYRVKTEKTTMMTKKQKAIREESSIRMLSIKLLI